jgi:RNA polymerase sigma-70 factor, ECF subfamily
MSTVSTAIPPHAAPQPSDEVLAVRARAGDQGAFATLYQRHRSALRGYAWRMVRRRELAEEVCTEAFVKLLQGAWRPCGSVRSFLFTVVHRHCIDLLRSRKRRVRLLPGAVATAVESGSPEASLVAGERRAGLERAAEGAGAPRPVGEGSELLPGERLLVRVSTTAAGSIALFEQRGEAWTRVSPEGWRVDAGQHALGGDQPLAWRSEAGSGAARYVAMLCHDEPGLASGLSQPGCAFDSVLVTWSE